MNKYSQNNFAQSNIAKESKSSKVLNILAMLVVGGVIVAFKFAVGN